VARGEVGLGFQQRAELLPLPGLQIVGVLPDPVAIVTTFSGAVATRSTRPGPARALLDFLASPETADTKRRHGMAPA
jgi:molybdate transport system substrate-binding protein